MAVTLACRVSPYGMHAWQQTLHVPRGADADEAQVREICAYCGQTRGFYV